MAFCYVCQKEVDNADFHHVIPQSRGGKEGPKICLCPTCHTEAHILATDKLIRAELIENRRLARVVLILKLSQQLPHAEYYKVQLNVPKDIYARLRQEAKDNQLSIPKIIISHLRAWVATKNLIKKGVILCFVVTVLSLR